MTTEPERLPHLGDRYIPERLLGVGGMGKVYLAKDVRHGRQVAIKVLNRDLSAPVQAHRFHREIQIAARLSHPHILPVFDSGEIDGHLYYVMPYVEGETLRDHLQRVTSLPVEQAIAWAAEVAEGLSFLHEHGILHRDIKPENLLVQSGHLVIADLGIAQAINQGGEQTMTSAQMVLGTPVYMSPEQATASGRLGPPTDVYALACVVYEMLSGEPPFTGGSAQSILSKKLSGHYASLKVVRPMAGRALERVLARGLAPNAADRYPTAEAFRRDLVAARAGKPGRVRPFAAAVVLSVAAGGAAFLAMRRSTASEESAERRVVVAPFVNRTGETAWDPLRFMAADWITEGLQRTGEVAVVPSVAALTTANDPQVLASTTDPVRALARATGARLVVTGTVYRDRGTLVFEAQLADAAEGTLVGAVPSIRTADSTPSEGLRELRARLMGLLAISLDNRVVGAEQPPTFEAYRSFSQGMETYVRNDFGAASEHFERAHALDTTFALPLLYASFCRSNEDDYAAADSLLRIVDRRRTELSEHDRAWLDYRRAELAGNDQEALAAIRRASLLAPNSKATYNFAVQALEARRAFEAESALATVSPDIASMRGWLPFWDVLASALHVQGKHDAELEAGHEARRRFPHRLEGYRPEARALAAEREISALDELWGEALREASPAGAEAADLALEIAAELWGHGDSVHAQTWYNRAYSAILKAGGASGTVFETWVRARATMGLRRTPEAMALLGSLARAPKPEPAHLGALGAMLASAGNRDAAESLLVRLERDTSAYTYGRPQFHAARVAIVLGQVDRAVALLGSSYRRGLPYDLEFHRDEILHRLRGEPILRELAARRN